MNSPSHTQLKPIEKPLVKTSSINTTQQNIIDEEIFNSIESPQLLTRNKPSIKSKLNNIQKYNVDNLLYDENQLNDKPLFSNKHELSARNNFLLDEIENELKNQRVKPIIDRSEKSIRDKIILDEIENDFELNEQQKNNENLLMSTSLLSLNQSHDINENILSNSQFKSHNKQQSIENYLIDEVIDQKTLSSKQQNTISSKEWLAESLNKTSIDYLNKTGLDTTCMAANTLFLNENDLKKKKIKYIKYVLFHFFL